MYEVIREIGIKKSLKYAFGQLQSMIIDSRLLLPPLRGVLLRMFGARIGKGVVVEPCSFFNIHVVGFRSLSVGSYSYIGTEVLLDLTDRIELGEDVTISARVIVLTHHNVGHAHRHPLAQCYPRKQAPVRFERGCFIGAGSTILAGVTIGEMSVVGAGSVVTADVPPHTVVGGVPAKFIKHSIECDDQNT